MHRPRPILLLPALCPDLPTLTSFPPSTPPPPLPSLLGAPPHWPARPVPHSIVDDYTFLFEAEEAKGMWRTLTAELLAFGEGVDARNEARERAGRRAYRVFEPRNIETSVAV